MLKEIVSKYLSQVLTALTVVGLVYFAYTMWQNNRDLKRKYQELVGTQEKFEALSKYTAKLEVQYKEQAEIAKKADAKWQEVVRQKNEQIQVLSDATYLIGKHAQKQDGPDYFFETPKKTNNYVLNEVRIAGENSPPIGFVMIKKDGRTYKGNYPFELRVESLQTKDASTGRVKVYSKAFLVAQDNGLAEKRRTDFKKWKGVEYPLEVTGGVADVDPTLPPEGAEKFMLWAPHLNGGFNVGGDSGGLFFRPEINFSFSGYGVSRNDLSWKFLQFGIGAETNFSTVDFHVIPFTHRFFPAILTNTYIGPGMGFSNRGTSFFLNTSLSF